MESLTSGGGDLSESLFNLPYTVSLSLWPAKPCLVIFSEALPRSLIRFLFGGRIWHHYLIILGGKWNLSYTLNPLCGNQHGQHSLQQQRKSGYRCPHGLPLPGWPPKAVLWWSCSLEPPFTLRAVLSNQWDVIRRTVYGFLVDLGGHGDFFTWFPSVRDWGHLGGRASSFWSVPPPALWWVEEFYRLNPGPCVC